MMTTPHSKSSNTESEIEGVSTTVVCLGNIGLDEYSIPNTNLSVKTYTDPCICIAYLMANPNDKVFFIISDPFDRSVLELLHNLKQIVAIYQFQHKSETSQQKLTKQYFKLSSNIFVNINELFQQLLLDVTKMTNNRLTQRINNFLGFKAEFSTSTFQSTIPAVEISINSLNQQQATFIWFQLLTDVLLYQPKITNKAYSKMLEECRHYYKDNSTAQKSIDEFETEYTSDKAILWYTRPSFLANLLNTALRTENMRTTLQFRDFIVDIYQQLLKSCSSTNYKYPFTVYRGQSMNLMELKKLKSNVGGFISFNTFFSTSLSSQLALSHAGDKYCSAFYESVLFEIEIKTMNANKPFANIHYLSYRREEDEILFCMGTVFRIDYVVQLLSKIWHIKLILSNKEVHEIDALMSGVKSEFDKSLTIYNLGNFWHERGEFDKAIDYCELLLEEFDADQTAMSIINNNIGLIYESMDEYDSAIRYFDKAIELHGAP
ncbi:unnamed protein product, partial [Didymodactylos carnosus]